MTNLKYFGIFRPISVSETTAIIKTCKFTVVSSGPFCQIYRVTYRGYHVWSCQNVCDDLSFLLDNIYITVCTKLYRQIVGIPMGTNCAPLVADLFLFCYESDFMKGLSSDNQADVIKAFNSTSRYLDDLLNIDNPYFEGMVNQIYPSKLQLNKPNTSDTEAPFLDLHLSISNGFVSSKIYVNVMTLILI